MASVVNLKDKLEILSSLLLTLLSSLLNHFCSMILSSKTKDSERSKFLILGQIVYAINTRKYLANLKKIVGFAINATFGPRLIEYNT